jgi:O-antigen/teichoic acid export membrane protein
MIGSMPRLGRDSLLLAPGFVVPGVISLILIPFLFGSLGASQYGVLALILAVANGVPMLTTSWLEAVLVRFSHHGEFETPRWVIGASLLASALVGGLVAVLFIPTPDAPVIVITAVFTAAVGAYLLVVARLQSLMRFGAISRGATIRSILGGVLAVALGGVSGMASMAAVGLVIGFVAGTLIMVVDERRGGRQAEVSAVADGSTGGPARTGRRELARYGAGSLAVAASLYVLSVGDRFVLSAVRPLSEVGIYAATYGIVDLLFRLVPSVVFVAVRPQVFRSWDRGDRRHVLSLVALVACGLGWLLGAMSIGLLVVAGATDRLPIDPLLAGPITVGLAAFMVANAFAILYAAQKRQARLGVNLALAATLNIALNVAFAPLLGAYGSALATFIGYTALLALNLWGLRAAGDVKPPAILAALVVGLGAVAANGLVAGTGAWPIGAGAAAIVLLGLAPIIFRLVRGFPWPSDGSVESASSAAPDDVAEQGQLL